LNLCSGGKIAEEIELTQVEHSGGVKPRALGHRWEKTWQVGGRTEAFKTEKEFFKLPLRGSRWKKKSKSPWKKKRGFHKEGRSKWKKLSKSSPNPGSEWKGLPFT